MDFILADLRMRNDVINMLNSAYIQEAKCRGSRFIVAMGLTSIIDIEDCRWKLQKYVTSQNQGAY